MKIRGKLILWFGSVTLLILLAYAVVVYISLKESIARNQDEKFGNLALAASLACEQEVTKIISKVDTLFLTISGGASDTGGDLLRQMILETPLLRGAAIVSENRILLGEGEIPAAKTQRELLAEMNKQVRGRTPIDIIIDNETTAYLVKPRKDKNNGAGTLVLTIDRQALDEIFNTTLRLENTRLLLFAGKERFADLTFNGSATSASSSIGDDSHILAESSSGHFVPVDQWFVYRPVRQVWGLDFIYMLPAEIYLADLVKLKNRVIATTIVLAWIAVWGILILAYRISDPLVKLARVTNDMITFNYRTPFDFSPGEDEIGALARSIGSMRQRIEQLVVRDPLTRTYNRLYLMHAFENAFAKAMRLEENLCCIILDIDYFKKVNDTYGHQAGDEILHAVAGILLKNTREYDTVATVARYGGEEFVILLSDTDLKAAHAVAERLRAAVERYEMPHGIRCTISLGLSIMDPNRHASPEALLQDADTALYKAKETGRNKLVVYDDMAGD